MPARVRVKVREASIGLVEAAVFWTSLEGQIHLKEAWDEAWDE